MPRAGARGDHTSQLIKKVSSSTYSVDLESSLCRSPMNVEQILSQDIIHTDSRLSLDLPISCYESCARVVYPQWVSRAGELGTFPSPRRCGRKLVVVYCCCGCFIVRPCGLYLPLRVIGKSSTLVAVFFLPRTAVLCHCGALKTRKTEHSNI